MAAVTQERIEQVVMLLWAGVYEASFRGKNRGRFVITREQLKKALGVDRLHYVTVRNLQDSALKKGLVIVDLDDLFPCIETRVVRGYRKTPSELFDQLCEHYVDADEAEVSEEEEVADDDE